MERVRRVALVAANIFLKIFDPVVRLNFLNTDQCQALWQIESVRHVAIVASNIFFKIFDPVVQLNFLNAEHCQASWLPVDTCNQNSKRNSFLK